MDDVQEAVEGDGAEQHHVDTDEPDAHSGVEDAHAVVERPAARVEDERLQRQHRPAVHNLRRAEVADEDAVDVAAQSRCHDGQHSEQVPHKPTPPQYDRQPLR